MSSLFNSMVSMGKAAMQKFQGPTDPNAVVSVDVTQLSNVPVVQRHECLILYGPKMMSGRDPKDPPQETYEIVIHNERGLCFSLCRDVNLSSLSTRFDYLKALLPLLFELESSLCTLPNLQLYCDFIRKTPSANLAHLAVYFDLRNVIPRDQLKSQLDGQDMDGVTPLMLAVKKENCFMVMFLVSRKVSLSKMDSKKNSVYHYAASTNMSIVELLVSENPAKDLNSCNEEGNTPLHIACKKDKPDCVQALLCCGADVNVAGTVDQDSPFYTALKSSNSRCVKEIIKQYPKQLHTHDIKFGGTPLHWAKSKDIAEALIDHGCIVDAKNFNGKTALHVMTEHSRLDCVMALLTSGADINMKDDDGNTPLHLSVLLGNAILVKTFLSFDCETNVKNKEGLTPWALAEKTYNSISMMDFKDREGVLYALYAVGANGGATPRDKKGIEIDFQKCKAKLSPQHRRTRARFDDFLAQKAKISKSKDGKKGGRVLCLDGGGIKGIVLCRMLMSMEKALQTPIVHCFDWICGTSTGGMLALSLCTGKSVMECLYIYMKLKDKVFVNTKPYETEEMEKLLKAVFGENTKMFDIKQPRVIVTATIADRTPPEVQLFRNYDSPQEMLGVSDFDHPELPFSPFVSSDQLVWKAARASGAAPSFFRPQGKYVDGGILSNNPVLTFLTEIAEYNIAQKALGHDEQVMQPSILLSMGTGVPPVQKATVVDIFRPGSASDTFKLLMNYDGMGKLLLESVLDADCKAVDQSRAWCLSTGTRYHRYSPYMLADIELDEKDETKLVEWLWMTMAYMHSKRSEIQELKALLVCDNN